MPNRAQRAANKVLRETKNAAKAKARDKRKTQRKTQETMDTVCGDEAGPKIWKNSRTSLRHGPKLAKISGGVKPDIFKCASFSPSLSSSPSSLLSSTQHGATFCVKKSARNCLKSSPINHSALFAAPSEYVLQVLLIVCCLLCPLGN